MSRRISQTQQIEAYMKKHGSITHKEAEVLCGCTRIAARAHENGWPGKLEYKNGVRYSRYTLGE